MNISKSEAAGMFYRMIKAASDAWYAAADCPVKSLLDYIVRTDEMRDAQIDAIKTYLFLKIAGENRPLWRLFADGFFCTSDVGELDASDRAKKVLRENPAALALFEYATLTNEKGDPVCVKLATAIKKCDAIDYEKILKEIFYGVSYADYLFSLPMGAGKTFLMAAFIYLDLYFSTNEPDSPIFAHNFIVLAPSGLKASVVPSLRTIQNFDPTWIIPEPVASQLKRELKFEVLDQNKTAKKSNRTQNPNAQKINLHQPLSELRGLVLVTNAEKVILDRGLRERDGLFEVVNESDDERDRQANELRNLIGKLPNLAIYIDEVHHATSDEIKLRAVVNYWMANKQNQINGVVSFSGTPYLDKAEKVNIGDGFAIAGAEITNVVYYYPLIDGVGNFLKSPTVVISENENSLEIVEKGLRRFLNDYRNTVYANGTTAKIGVYCGTIEKLEEQIYPLAVKVAEDCGLNPAETVLKFHKGNSQHSTPPDSQLKFDTLDKALSPIRIVLLVQIGKEGWDCKSLTGIILSHEKDCLRNMVLQTSCRCLRQVDKNANETAAIYLNAANAKVLNEQLKRQHHTSISELERAKKSPLTTLNRYDRTDYLKLPPLDFYQLKISYETLVISEKTDPADEIVAAITPDAKTHEITTAQDFTAKVIDRSVTSEERGDKVANFNYWLFAIVKESFGLMAMADLSPHHDILQNIFATVTYAKNSQQYFSSQYRLDIINANIRRAFYEKRTLEVREELITQNANLLNIVNFTSTIETDKPQKYYPNQKETDKIVRADKGELSPTPDAKMQQALALLQEIGREDAAQTLREGNVFHPQKDRSFHYIPYRTDSRFEQEFLEEVLTQNCVKQKDLEVYYNGDDALTEFKICCYKKSGKRWNYLGRYTPDFLIISRKDRRIDKAIIVETKGGIYANDERFIAKKEFVQSEFIRQNNEKFGYARFDYLYLEDSLSENERIIKTAKAVEKFFA
ncbi:MAG: hypothetical protein ACRC46_09015 [Thermoguttaceae bacterium]